MGLQIPNFNPVLPFGENGQLVCATRVKNGQYLTSQDCATSQLKGNELAETDVKNLLRGNLQHGFFWINIGNINITLTNYVRSQVQENI